MASPLRRFLENPETILGPHVRPGMTVLDVGSAMGFFSLPLARMVGETGRVLCVDVEPRMLEGLVRRGTEAGLMGRIEPILCGSRDLGLAGRDGTVDLAIAIHVLHEMPDIAGAVRQTATVLRRGGRLLLIEPKVHVSPKTFDFELEAAGRVGLRVVRQPPLRWRFAAVLEKGAGSATESVEKRAQEQTSADNVQG